MLLSYPVIRHPLNKLHQTNAHCNHSQTRTMFLLFFFILFVFSLAPFLFPYCHHLTLFLGRDSHRCNYGSHLVFRPLLGQTQNPLRLLPRPPLPVEGPCCSLYGVLLVCAVVTLLPARSFCHSLRLSVSSQEYHPRTPPDKRQISAR